MKEREERRSKRAQEMVNRGNAYSIQYIRDQEKKAKAKRNAEKKAKAKTKLFSLMRRR